MFIEVLKTTFPVFAVIGVGYAFALFRKIDLESVTGLILYLLAPCLIVDSLSKNTLSAGAFGQVFLSVQCIVFGTGAAAWLLFRTFKIRQGGLYLPAMFMNSANLPMSLCVFAFGEKALSASVAGYVSLCLTHFSVGVRMIGGRAGGWGDVLKMPLIHAAVVGLTLGALRIETPPYIMGGFHLLGQACIPLMLFSLGYQLQELKPAPSGPALLAVAIRMIVGPAIGIAAWKLFGLRGDVARAVLLVSVMPSAVMNFVLARKYRRDVEHVSAAIFYGSLFGIAAIPAMLYGIARWVP